MPTRSHTSSTFPNAIAGGVPFLLFILSKHACEVDIAVPSIPACSPSATYYSGVGANAEPGTRYDLAISFLWAAQKVRNDDWIKLVQKASSSGYVWSYNTADLVSFCARRHSLYQTIGTRACSRLTCTAISDKDNLNHNRQGGLIRPTYSNLVLIMTNQVLLYRHRRAPHEWRLHNLI